MIALDANGADRGPRNVAEGARLSGVPVTVFGPAAELTGFEDLEVVDAPVAITNDEEPAHAVRAKPDASVVQAVRAVKDGRAGGFVTPEDLDLRLTFEDARSGGYTLGSGVIMAFDDGTDLMDLAHKLPSPRSPS